MKYKGKRIRVALRVPQAIYEQLERIRKPQTLNDFIVKLLSVRTKVPIEPDQPRPNYDV